jgi:putative Holliday junction resolvase
MALDIGEARIGVAMSDPDGRVATPHSVLDARASDLRRKLGRLAVDYEVELIVVGMPLTLGGAQGPQGAHVREVATALAGSLGLPLEFCDERLSSAQARRSLRESGMSEQEMRGRVDMVAASLVLQSYLDAQQA